MCTHFTTPSGIVDKGNHSCAGDLAAIARAVLREPRLARIVKRKRAVLPFPIKGGRLWLYNHNPLLRANYRRHHRAQDGLHGRRGPLPGGDGDARPGQARRRPAALARPRQAGDAAARPRLRRLTSAMIG